jgi:hypothetical protein
MSLSEVAGITTKMSTTDIAETTTARRGYHGSCHCGIVKYVVYLQFPPLTETGGPTRTNSVKQPLVRIRKCNCSTCHKMGFFHVRLPHASNDFALLSPLDPLTALGDYTCFEGLIHWLFCKKCAVRCFAFSGEGEVSQKEMNGVVTKFWAPKVDDRHRNGGPGSYLSVNGQTLEPGQEGLDLKDWHEKKWVCYLDTLDEKEEDRYGVPQRGGTY